MRILEGEAEMMRNVGIGLLLLLAVAGCGRKEAPQVLDPNAAPQIIELQSEVKGPVLVLKFRLVGDPEGIGYQIDRTEMDPYCKCPGFWRRYYDQQPFARQVGVEMTKEINLRALNRDFLFRIRAIDSKGRLGKWSEPIQARAVDLMQ
jgi:hypothetical protein